MLENYAANGYDSSESCSIEGHTQSTQTKHFVWVQGYCWQNNANSCSCYYNENFHSIPQLSRFPFHLSSTSKLPPIQTTLLLPLSFHCLQMSWGHFRPILFNVNNAIYRRNIRFVKTSGWKNKLLFCFSVLLSWARCENLIHSQSSRYKYTLSPASPPSSQQQHKLLIWFFMCVRRTLDG